MAVELDYMEHPDDPAAQAAYKSNGHHPVTFVGTAQLDTAVKKFGSSSLLLDGNSDYLSIPDNTDWNLTTNFTVGCQVRHTDHVGIEQYIVQAVSNDFYWFLRHVHGTGTQFIYKNTATNRVDLVAGEITDSTWHWVVMCKVGTDWGLYKDGTQIAYASGNPTIGDFAANLEIGNATWVGNEWLDGHLDDIIINHSNIFGAAPQANLSDTITVPTAPHRADTNTKLLLHFDGADEAQTTVDWSRLESRSESIIKQQGSYSLGVFAKGTDSLNDTLTRTVDPTVNLSDLTQNKLGIYALRTGSNIKISIRDSGSTLTEITPNVTQANTWQTVEWDISGVANADKDAIDRIIVTIVNADEDNIFCLDNMFGGWPAFTFAESLGLLETLPILGRGLALEESLALSEDLLEPLRALLLEESLALKEEETAHLSSLLTESLGLLESLPTLERALTLEESLALLEALTEESRALTLEEALALLESLPTLERALILEEALALKEAETADIQALMTESLALKEDLTQLGRALTLEESLALLEEAHAETLLFKVDKSGNVIIPSLKDAGDAYVYIDSEGKLHRGAGYP